MEPLSASEDLEPLARTLELCTGSLSEVNIDLPRERVAPSTLERFISCCKNATKLTLRHFRGHEILTYQEDFPASEN